MFSKILRIFIISLTFLAVMSSTQAKDIEKNDQLARVALITAKDGHDKALEDAIVKYHKFVSNKKGSWRYDWFSIETGPDTGKYIARSGSHNWADFDAEHDWDKEAGEKFNKWVAPHIADFKVSITQTDMKVGKWPKDIKGYNYFLLSKWHIKSGKSEAFKEGLKKVDGILKEGGWPNYYSFVDTVSGGHGNTKLLVSPRKNFADMGPKEPKFMDILKKAMGEKEAGTFMKEWGMTYKNGDYWMVKHLPRHSDYGDKK